jgi:glycosyltransferase involved in cell wall biosynthesis
MTRLLFISRYRNASMHRKVELLAEQHGFTVLQIAPREWRDEFGVVVNSGWQSADGRSRRDLLDMRGRINDPHRATYRTLDFGMRAFNPDVICAEEEPDSLAALQIAAARAVFAPRAKLALYTWQNLRRPMGTGARTVMRLALRAADAVICANQEAVALLRGAGYARATPLIPAIGVDRTHFFADAAAPVAGPLRIVYAGRLDINKGLDTLIDAVRALRENPARLTFIGDGPDRAAIEARVVTAGISQLVNFAGALPPDRLGAALRDHDVLVLASRATPTWKEQFGRVLIEAMACGVIPVGSDSGAIPEVIGDAGLIFPTDDVGALAAALDRLMTDTTLRGELRARSVARVEAQYTQERIAAQTAEFVEALIT